MAIHENREKSGNKIWTKTNELLKLEIIFVSLNMSARSRDHKRRNNYFESSWVCARVIAATAKRVSFFKICLRPNQNKNKGETKETTTFWQRRTIPPSVVTDKCKVIILCVALRCNYFYCIFNGLHAVRRLLCLCIFDVLCMFFASRCVFAFGRRLVQR